MSISTKKSLLIPMPLPSSHVPESNQNMDLETDQQHMGSPFGNNDSKKSTDSLEELPTSGINPFSGTSRMATVLP